MQLEGFGQSGYAMKEERDRQPIWKQEVGGTNNLPDNVGVEAVYQARYPQEFDQAFAGIVNYVWIGCYYALHRQSPEDGFYLGQQGLHVVMKIVRHTHNRRILIRNDRDRRWQFV